MKTKGRKDHYIPRGYLRGFIDPAREKLQQPLWYFNIGTRAWLTRSVGEVGHRIGFYDYATTEAGFESPDETFSELERKFPQVRAQIENNFESWHDHLDFLLRFAQMMRARSLLFFEQRRKAWKDTPTWRVKEVLSPTSLKLELMTPSPPPEEFIRNRSILDMQEQIKKGSAWAAEYHWALRYTDSIDEPFIISESPLVSTVPNPPNMLILPISWRACLFGTRDDHGQERTGKVDVSNLRDIRAMYRRGAKLYLVSPIKLVDLS
jgi:hypothetical protein